MLVRIGARSVGHRRDKRLDDAATGRSVAASTIDWSKHSHLSIRHAFS